jgi:Rha family phage regulatory protein
MHVSKFTPEQLIASLVSEYQKQPVTTSLIVAEHFSKRHAHILESIKSILEDESAKSTEPEFWLSEYRDSTGRSLPMYVMGRDGFSLLAMGFTGKKALAFKRDYIRAFNNMESHLKRRDEWEPIRSLGKGMRRDLTDAIQEFIQYAKVRGASKGADHYYANFTKLEYQLLFAVATGMQKGFRNILDIESLETLAYTEKALARHIRREMELGREYKDIYQTAKSIAQMSIDIMGGRRVLPELILA